MANVLTIDDLIADKKHSTFFAEVVTGKAGGLSSGSPISTSINQVTGQVQKTIPAIAKTVEDDFAARVAGMAFTRVGTFAAGATLTDMRQTLLWEVSQGGDGHEYGWSGAFPKVVPPASTPAGTGGIGAGAWVDRTDATLRGELSGGNGDLVQYIPFGLSSTARSLRSKLGECVSVADFGAVGDGVVNNGPMFVAAAAYVGDGGSVLIPPGRWRIAGDYALRPVNFIGSGQGATVIEFDMTLGKFNGLNFQAPTIPQVGFGITNATIKVIGGRGGNAIITPTDSFVNLFPKPTFEHLSFCSDSANDPAEGFAQAYSWDWMFLLGDAMCLTMRAIDALGSYKPTVNPALQDLDGFIRTVPTQGILSARISNITTNNVANFFEIKQKTYFHLSDIDVARAYKGIYDAPDRVFETNRYAYGESVWKGVIINAQKAPVDLKNRFALLAFGLIVHRAGGAFDDGTEWVGVKLKGGRVNKIVAPEISSASGYSGGAVGILFDGGDDNQVSSPSFGTLTSCVRAGVAASAEGAAQALSVTDVSLSANVGVVFDVQNARSLKVAGFRKSSAYSYTTFAKFADSISESSSRFLQTPYRATLEHTDRISLYNETAGTDLKRILLDTSAGLTMTTRTDGDGIGNNFFIAARTGIVVDRVELRTKATTGGYIYLNSPETQVGQLKPYTGNTFLCGTNPSPWSGGFTQTAFTVTSDENYKSEPLEITDAMLDAMAEVNWVQYKYLDRIEAKGVDGARWHFGAIAQRVVEAFARHGLDAHEFGFICYDEWETKDAVLDEDGNVVTEAVEAGSRYGIRYEEALVIEAALHRRNYQRLLARVEALEVK